MKLFIDGSALLKRKEGYMEYTDGTLQGNIITIQKLQNEIEALKNESMYRTGDIIDVGQMFLNGFITGNAHDAKFFIPLGKPIASDVSTVRVSGRFKFRQNGQYIKDYETTYGFDTANGTDVTAYFNVLGVGILIKMAGGGAFPNMTNNDCVSSEFTYVKIEFK